jgi:8-oxo-dGTP pyrophosphatase MutT (NUDIX family)
MVAPTRKFSVMPNASVRKVLKSTRIKKIRRLQYAALCYRLNGGKVQILMITSHSGHRWTIPKGWPIRGRKPEETAAQEAWEEAGVKGKARDNCIGGFSYRKRSNPQPHFALVFPIKVKKLDKRFPERGERKRRWMSREKAASVIKEKELAQLLRRFDPAALGR